MHFSRELARNTTAGAGFIVHLKCSRRRDLQDEKRSAHISRRQNLSWPEKDVFTAGLVFHSLAELSLPVVLRFEGRQVLGWRPIRWLEAQNRLQETSITGPAFLNRYIFRSLWRYCFSPLNALLLVEPTMRFRRLF